MCYNDIGPVGATALAEALQVRCCISNLFHCFFYHFKLNSSVEVFLMDGNKIGQYGGMQIASMLQVNDVITILSLADTDLTTDCVVAVATVLRANQTILNINLSNPLLHSQQEDTTHHLAHMLEVNKCLKELKLQKHGMTDKGAEVLCRFLKRNHSLVKLDISW